MNPTQITRRPGAFTRRLACLLTIVSAGLIAPTGFAAFENVPANPNASTATRNVLKFLAALPDRPGNLKKCISGQFAGDSSFDPGTGKYNFESGYQNLIVNLANSTEDTAAGEPKRWVGLMGLDFCDSGIGGDNIASGAPGDPASAMGKLVASAANYWNAGGLVTFSAHMRNPWSNGNYRDKTQIPRTTEGYVNFAQLYNANSSTAYTRFHADLDKIAAALQNLKNRTNSVVVLFRPLHELNSGSFWWSYTEADENNPAPNHLAAVNRHASEYRKLWQHVFDYLTVNKSLNNVLFVWCVVRASSDPYRNMEIPANSDRYFPDAVAPAKKYCDLVALDYYGDQLGTFTDGVSYFDRLENLYVNLKHHNRPVALGECGRTADENASDLEVWNNQKHIQNIRAIAQPTGSEVGDGFVYFLNWRGRWSIFDNDPSPTNLTNNSIKHVELMRNGWTLNRNEPTANALHNQPTW